MNQRRFRGEVVMSFLNQRRMQRRFRAFFDETNPTSPVAHQLTIGHLMLQSPPLADRTQWPPTSRVRITTRRFGRVEETMKYFLTAMLLGIFASNVFGQSVSIEEAERRLQ